MRINTVIKLLRKKKETQILSVTNLSKDIIKGLAINSKLLKDGYAFFCLKGAQFNGYRFIPEACRRGARLIITEQKINFNIPQEVTVIVVKDVARCLAIISNKFYDNPSQKLDMTAITGTNGKTTIAYILENILKSSKNKVGVIGTINYRFNDYRATPLNTTPDILTVQNFLHSMCRQKVRHCIMEVSSHALVQRRIEGIKFDRAIFTNLTQDHLDYHRTKENYFDAKLELFKKYLKNDGVAIINTDDEYGRRIKRLIKNHKVITYAIESKADVMVEAIRLSLEGSSFLVKCFKQETIVDTNLIGMHNIYNILASIAACSTLKIPLRKILLGVRNVSIPGRLERIHSNRKLNIFVDYAHTEDALRNVLSSLKMLQPKGRIITVFGCGGDRDKGKRSKMGKVVSELSDIAIITSDNPRSENPRSIIRDIVKGIKKSNYIQVIDRYKAIIEAIDNAKENDIIVVAGKGHESYQIIKNKRIPFDDRKAIKEILKKCHF